MRRNKVLLSRMLLRNLLFLLVTVTLGCSSLGSSSYDLPYKFFGEAPPFERLTDRSTDGGFTDKQLSERMYVTRVWADPKFNKVDVHFITTLRSDLVCRRKGYKLSYGVKTLDRSQHRSKGKPKDKIPDIEDELDICEKGYKCDTPEESYSVFDRYYFCTNQNTVIDADIEDNSNSSRKSIEVVGLRRSSLNKGKLIIGDQILRVDGKIVKNKFDLDYYVNKSGNSIVNLKILRNGTKISLVAKKIDSTSGRIQRFHAFKNEICSSSSFKRYKKELCTE